MATYNGSSKVLDSTELNWPIDVSYFTFLNGNIVGWTVGANTNYPSVDNVYSSYNEIGAFDDFVSYSGVCAVTYSPGTWTLSSSNSVPIPSSVFLLGPALLVLGWFRLRMRASKTC